MYPLEPANSFCLLTERRLIIPDTIDSFASTSAPVDRTTAPATGSVSARPSGTRPTDSAARSSEQRPPHKAGTGSSLRLLPRRPCRPAGRSWSDTHSKNSRMVFIGGWSPSRPKRRAVWHDRFSWASSGWAGESC